MKFKLVKVGEELHLLSCDGSISIISFFEATELTYRYDSFSAERTENVKLLKAFEKYEGKHLLTLRDDNVLEIHDADFVRQLMYPSEFPYYTPDEFAAKHQKQSRIVRQMCTNNRIDGAVSIGGCWFIPKVSPYPEDKRAGRKMPSRRKH